jgi:hypothetical protein
MPTQQTALSCAQPADDGTPHGERRADVREGGESAGCSLSALRLVPVPETGPPFDGEFPPDATVTAAIPGGSFGWSLAGLDHGRRASTYAGRRAAGSGAGSGAGGRAGPGAEDEWSRQFALLLTETLAGARPLRQLLPWMTDRARGHVDKLMPLFSGGQHPRVQRVITNRPARDAIEMTVIVGVGTRTRAIAARLERTRQQRRAHGPHAAARPRVPAPPRVPEMAGRTPPQWLCTDIEAA